MQWDRVFESVRHEEAYRRVLKKIGSKLNTATRPFRHVEYVMLCLDTNQSTMEYTLVTPKGPDENVGGNSLACLWHNSLASPGRLVNRSEPPLRLRGDAKEMP